MDFTKQYIDMCREATEIQRDWKMDRKEFNMICPIMSRPTSEFLFDGKLCDVECLKEKYVAWQPIMKYMGEGKKPIEKAYCKLIDKN